MVDRAKILEVLCVMLAAIIVGAMLILAGCTELPACDWHGVTRQELADRCMDWDVRLKGCQVNRGGRCDLYVYDPEQPAAPK
jgi:hypothetical protein